MGPGTVHDTPGDGPSVHLAAAAPCRGAGDRSRPAAICNIVDDGGLVSNALAREVLGFGVIVALC